MDTMPIKVVILNAMPEAMLLIYLGLVLIGIKPSKKRVFIAGIIQGIACFYIRKHFDFGPHLLLQYVSLAVITWAIVKAPFFAVLISTAIAITMAILLESTTTIFITNITEITMAEVMSRGFLRIIVSMPYLLILIILAYVVTRHKFTLEQEIKILSKLNQKVK
ncbi:hypothetical protein SAMN05660297_00763 [Natronincola peptidivorans]|uniref:Uncharacterized protein n=1 Tax=Natronincola peptidivorans TaxID=426128 RepID=A0A1H9ZX88_9FIRM|nr:hypothetical protein [Natronincola peptidivorans]SES86336.1 hypothetical protein SAMN05660297_00763 [Natronincola peptidivorans]